MNTKQLLQNLKTPERIVDVVLDTDAYNEIDDQFAISYMLRSPERINVRGICAAPFFNEKSSSPEDGMRKSYDEILKILDLAGKPELTDLVFYGSESFMEEESKPILSDAARFLASLAKEYSSDNPLYIVAIGTITNVASALLLEPELREKAVVVWLGGNEMFRPMTDEFNLRQDLRAARVIFGCGVPVVQLPCCGVVDHFTVSRPELEYWLLGKNPLADYLARNTISCGDSYALGKPWTRVIWDVTAIGWLLNDGERFMHDELSPVPQIGLDGSWSFGDGERKIRRVIHINRDALMEDLIEKLASETC